MVSNLLVFALWYWELDRGGPRHRESDGGDTPDFLFPQMTDAKELMPDWQPAFSDYLYTVEHERDGLQPDRHDAHHGRGQASDVGPVALVVRAGRARDRARRQHPALSQAADPRRNASRNRDGRDRPAPGLLSSVNAPPRASARSRSEARPM